MPCQRMPNASKTWVNYNIFLTFYTHFPFCDGVSEAATEKKCSWILQTVVEVVVIQLVVVVIVVVVVGIT